jgi:hypothetical protein
VHATGDDETVAMRASALTAVQPRSFQYDQVYGPDANQGRSRFLRLAAAWAVTVAAS